MGAHAQVCTQGHIYIYIYIYIYIPSLQGLTEVQNGNIVKVSIAKTYKLPSETRARDIKDQIEALVDSEIDHTHNKKNKHNYLAERLRQFTPKSKRKGLQAIRAADGSTYADAERVIDAVGEHWGSVFKDKKIDISAAKVFCRRTASSLKKRHSG